MAKSLSWIWFQAEVRAAESTHSLWVWFQICQGAIHLKDKSVSVGGFAFFVLIYLMIYLGSIRGCSNTVFPWTHSRWLDGCDPIPRNLDLFLLLFLPRLWISSMVAGCAINFWIHKYNWLEFKRTLCRSSNLHHQVLSRNPKHFLASLFSAF